MLSTILLRFITSRAADGRAPRTLQDYRRVLEPFAAWCSNSDLDSITRQTIREYVATLRSKGWKNGTVAIHIRNLRAFLRWLHEEGYTHDCLSLAIKAPRHVSRIEIPITPQEVQLLLDTCASSGFHDLRDKAMILLLSDTGLRSGEVARLMTADWRREPDSGGSYLLVFSPKTSTARYAILGRVATTAVQVYVQRARARLDGDRLFCSETGEPLKVRAIGSMLVRRGKHAGLERCRVHPHIFRKAFVTAFLDNGGDSERLRVLVGWSSLAMLQVYADSRLERLKAAHQRAGPVDRMNLRVETAPQ